MECILCNMQYVKNPETPFNIIKHQPQIICQKRHRAKEHLQLTAVVDIQPFC